MPNYEEIEADLNISSKKKTSFAGDVVKLASGTTFAQALTVLAAPFLTRLYSPEAFGVLALFVSITSILAVVSCMRYELAIMLPKSDKEAANLLGVSLVFVILISALTVPAVWWGGYVVLRWLNAPGLLPYLWLVPLVVFIGGVFLAFNYWNSRTKHFGRLSIAQVTSSVTTVSTQLGAGYAGYATGGSLIGANVAGQAVAATVLGGRIWRDDKKLLLKSIRWKNMVAGIKRHRKFPMYSTWSGFLNTISWQLPAILLSAFFSPVIVGFYALGYRILEMPMNLIGTAIGQIFFQRAAEANAKGALAPLVENVFRRLVMIGLFPTLMLTIIGKDLFVVVFGANWAEAGVYAQILSLFVFFQFISSPLSTLFSVLERQGFGLGWNVVNFSTRLVFLGIGGLFGNARVVIFLFSATGVFLYGYLCYAIMRKAGVSVREIFRIVLSNILSFMPAGFILILLTILRVSPLAKFLSGCILTGCYFFYLLLTQKLVVKNLFKKQDLHEQQN